MSLPITPLALDHIVLRCADVEATLNWYCNEIGLEPYRVEEWRRGEVFFPSARISADTIIDFLPDRPDGQSNLDHLCIVVESIDMNVLASSGRFEVVDGPDRRSGARGDGTSLYVLDPDGTTVELRHY
ncbi:MAG: VOC family protein [Acidimicrobiales bacterium]